MRSCNGIRPPLGSRPSVAIAAWITWLSKDTPIQMNAKRPAGPNAIRQLRVEGNSADKQRGEILHANRGTSCHGENGAGIDENPLVWGANSFNQGAGFANNAQLAAWLRVAMPLDDANMTEQKAIDIGSMTLSEVLKVSPMGGLTGLAVISVSLFLAIEFVERRKKSSPGN